MRGGGGGGGQVVDTTRGESGLIWAPVPPLSGNNSSPIPNPSTHAPRLQSALIDAPAPQAHLSHFIWPGEQSRPPPFSPILSPSPLPPLAPLVHIITLPGPVSPKQAPPLSPSAIPAHCHCPPTVAYSSPHSPFSDLSCFGYQACVWVGWLSRESVLRSGNIQIRACLRTPGQGWVKWAYGGVN